MFRKDKSWKKLCEQLLETNHQLVRNNEKLINLNSSLLKKLELKNNKINEMKEYAKAIIDIWKDSESDTASLMTLNFGRLLEILDGEDK